MSRRIWPLRLSLLSIALICGVAGQPLRAADPRTADPEQGAVIDGAYVNAYFGLRYPLPPGWKAGPQPPRPSAGGYYVLEASSYQLELLATMMFDIAVLLNITPDHLDRHGGMDGYIAAKEHIFDRQGGQSTAIIGVDDGICAAMAERLRRGARRILPISVNRPVEGGVYVVDGILTDDTEA